MKILSPVVSLSLTALVFLAACQKNASSDPNYFEIGMKDGRDLMTSQGLLAGDFNPAGYTEEQISEIAAKVACRDENISPLTVRDKDQSLRTFVASCVSGAIDETGTYQVSRREDGTIQVKYEPFSASGRAYQRQIN